MNKEEVITEIALRCGDSNYKDFETSLYEQAYYRANREVAKTYQMLKKTISFTLSDRVDNVTDDIIFDIPDFNSEILVKVNNFPLKKTANHFEGTDRFVYYLEPLEGQWVFNYILGYFTTTLGNPQNIDITELMNVGITERTSEQIAQEAAYKGTEDQIVIMYNIIPNHETDLQGEFVIPGRYEEELINEGTTYIAKLGVAKFAIDTERQEKYKIVLRMYKTKSDKDKRLLTDKPFIKMKVWKFPDEV